MSAPEPTSVPAPSQTVTESQCGDMVYVPGFGWLEPQGHGEVIRDESIYENGNKIGVMGYSSDPSCCTILITIFAKRNRLQMNMLTLSLEYC